MASYKGWLSENPQDGEETEGGSGGLDVDLKHEIRTDVPEVKSWGLIRGGRSGEECRSELCTSVDGEL